MGENVAQKLIRSHLVSGKMEVGEDIHIRIDQTLTQDATGTMVMLELEAMHLDRVKTEVSCQYVDHNLLQTDFKNPDDHLFLQSACNRFGVWFSPPGNGVSHPVHMERFGRSGATLLGSDSHTPAAGSLGMLAIGTGGLEVALAMAGSSFLVKMPKIMGVKLTGKLPHWVSAKDVILEMLRRHDVKGGVGKIIEYYGPGLDCLSAMDRHVIANMGAELGATTSVFPSDKEVKRFLKQQGRPEAWTEIVADADATYDLHDEINLSELVPLIALPSSPGNVVPVRDVAGRKIFQAMIGSSANPAYRDFVVPAMVLQGLQVAGHVSLDINPSSRQVLENLTANGYLLDLIHAGARIHQPGCNGCIGMGQAPATDRISLRTVPRNFPGRSGTKEDQVYLCSPETAVASALTGEITDPRDLEKVKGIKYPKYDEPKKMLLNMEMVQEPSEKRCELVMGPNIQPLPDFSTLDDEIAGPVLLKMGDNVSTDEILPAGTRVLPFRSNIPAISQFAFSQIDEEYHIRAMKFQATGSLVVGGENYGQGSSREHAAIAPRYLGLRAVIAKSYARIHRKNLINFGMVPLYFTSDEDYDRINQEDELVIHAVREAVQGDRLIEVTNASQGYTFKVSHDLSDEERDMVLHGGLINLTMEKEKR